MAALIDGLPDAIALQCLARVPRSQHPVMSAVCRNWRGALKTRELFRLREEIGTSEEWLYVSAYDPDKLWQAYDPAEDRWITLPSIPTTISHLSNYGTASVDGKLFVMGGGSDEVDPVTGDRGTVVATNEVWMFDPILCIWQQRAPMLVARAQFACSSLDGHIVVAGGFTSTRVFIAAAERYNPATDTWEPLPDLCQTRNSPCSGVVLNGSFCVVHKEIPLAQELDLSRKEWHPVECSCSQGPMGLVNGELYVIFNGIVSQEHTEPAAPSRRPAQQGPICLWPVWYRRVGFGVAGLGGELYVVGGVTVPRQGDLNLVLLNELWICKVDGEQPFWRRGADMTVSKGTVLGCVVVKL